MTITRIDKTNEAFFNALLFEAAERTGPNILRLGVIDGGAACGAAAFELSGTTAQLTSIFVVPDSRRRGAGRALLEAFFSLARGTDVSSLSVTYLPEPQDSLTGFFDAMGFACFAGSPAYAVSYAEAKRSDRLQTYLAKADTTGRILSFAEFSGTQRREFDRILHTFGAALPEIAVGSFSQELSCAFFCRTGEITASLLCAECGERLNIDFLFSRANSAGPTLALVAWLADRIEARGHEPERIAFLAANPIVPAIADELFGKGMLPDGGAKYGVILLPRQPGPAG